MSEGFEHGVSRASTAPEKGPEKLPLFPIVNDEREYSFDEHPPLQNGTIVHYTCSHWSRPEDKRHRFILGKVIGDSPYIFKLQQNYSEKSDTFSLQSETEGYGFATTNLNPEDGKELFQTRAAFIESFTNYTQIPIENIESTPARTSYSVEEVKTCIERILTHPNATATKEELEYLSANYRGHEIFEMYKELYGEYMHGEHPNHRARARARSRLFSAMFKKYLTNWKVAETPDTISILLRRKNTAE